MDNLDSHISIVSESLSAFKSSTQDDFRELREEIGNARDGLDAVKLEVNELGGEIQVVKKNLESAKEDLGEVRQQIGVITDKLAGNEGSSQSIDSTSDISLYSKSCNGSFVATSENCSILFLVFRLASIRLTLLC